MPFDQIIISKSTAEIHWHEHSWYSTTQKEVLRNQLYFPQQLELSYLRRTLFSKHWSLYAGIFFRAIADSPVFTPYIDKKDFSRKFNRQKIKFLNSTYFNRPISPRTLGTVVQLNWKKISVALGASTAFLTQKPFTNFLSKYSTDYGMTGGFFYTFSTKGRYIAPVHHIFIRFSLNFNKSFSFSLLGSCIGNMVKLSNFFRDRYVDNSYMLLFSLIPEIQYKINI